MNSNFKTKILLVIFFLAGFFSCLIYSQCSKDAFLFKRNSLDSSRNGLTAPKTFENVFSDKDFPCLDNIQSMCIQKNRTLADENDPESFDFSWIQDVFQSGQNNFSEEIKLLILGENHYSAKTHKIRDDLFFYLNTESNFPLLLIEQPLSYTPYIRKYLAFDEDKHAQEFLKKNNFIFTFEEDLKLARKIRTWNKKNPLKKLTLGCTDIEHDMELTLKRLIWPWFERKTNGEKDIKQGETLAQKWSSIAADAKERTPEIQQLYIKKRDFLKKLSDRAAKYISVENTIKPKENRVDFIRPEEITDIIENMIYTLKARTFDFTYYRQKGIIRTITQGYILNNPLASSKAMFHAGSYHAATGLDYPDKGDFLREGSFFQNEFKPTSGKCFSIGVKTIFRSLGDKMKARNLQACVHTGSYYKTLVKKFQKSLQKGIITPDTLLTDQPFNALTALFYKKGLKYNSMPYIIKNVNSLAAWCKMSGITENAIDCYDHYIIVPESRLTQARYKFYTEN